MKISRLAVISSLLAVLLTSCNLLPKPKDKTSSSSSSGSESTTQTTTSTTEVPPTSDTTATVTTDVPIEGEIDANNIKSYTINQIVHSTVNTSNYYSGISSSMDKSSMTSALKTLMNKNYTTINYDSAETYMRDTDRDWVRSSDPNDENPYMILLYYTKNDGSDKQQLWNHYHTSVSEHGIPESQQSWDKEHIWAKSNGLTQKNSDFHHLRASDMKNNNTRSNFPLATCTTVSSYIQDFSGTNSSKKGTNKGVTVVEPLDEFKGDVARALMYMPLKFSVSLTNGTDSSGGKWGFLSDLIAWHKADPVDAFELRRNSLVQFYQGNRNPFIDHPEWVDIVYG